MAEAKHDSWHVASIVASYWFVSITMVFVNKILLSSFASIPAPLFVTWYQVSVLRSKHISVLDIHGVHEAHACVVLAIALGRKFHTIIARMICVCSAKFPLLMLCVQCALTCVICTVLGDVGENYRRQAVPSIFNQFPQVSMNSERSVKILPLSLVFVGMITFNNLCLQLVEVSFYNVARSLTLLFNVVLGYLMLGQKTSARVALTLVIVVVGFLVGVDGELNLSVSGTCAGVISSLFVALNAVYTSKMLPIVENDKSKLLYANNLNASILFIPFILVFERDTLRAHWATMLSPIFWCLMTSAGVFGFLIGLVTVMQVKATSALTHTISGTAKAAFQSLLAFYIWRNQPTVNGLIGTALVLGGSFLYALVKMGEQSKPKSAPPLMRNDEEIALIDKGAASGFVKERTSRSQK
jgi:GDP-fucose transporter C1